MQLRKVVFTALVAAILLSMLTTVGMAQPMRYKAELYCNWQKERTIEIVFDPQIGDQKARVFVGPATISPSPPSPPEGELVDLAKDGDDRWTYRRSGAVRSATIKKDENATFIIFYFTRGSNYAEGELKPVQ
jgi:hypothetical protein